MPSDILVTDQNSFRQNIVANARSFFCKSWFQNGVLQLGSGALLINVKTPISQIEIGSAVSALTFCPNDFDGEKIFGGAPPFSGGQCPVRYQVFLQAKYAGQSAVTNTNVEVTGPVIDVGYFNNPDNNVSAWYVRAAPGHNGGASGYYLVSYSAASVFEYMRITSVVRKDGEPDNCGSPPSDPPAQIITNTQEGDTIDNSTVNDNRDYRLVMPMNYSLGGVVGVMNMPFSNPRVSNHMPLRFSADVGGIRLHFGDNNGEFELLPPEDSTEIEGLDSILSRLSKLEECVCKPAVELDMLSLPLMQETDGECNDISINLMAARGSYPVNIAQQFEQSRVLAERGCEEAPNNAPRELLMQATSTENQRIFTTGKLSEDVRVVEIEITNFGLDTRLYFGDSTNGSQGRYGLAFPGVFNTQNVFASGTGIPLYYRNNTIPLSDGLRGEQGLRVSVPSSTSFNIWDTGIRY